MDTTKDIHKTATSEVLNSYLDQMIDEFENFLGTETYEKAFVTCDSKFFDSGKLNKFLELLHPDYQNIGVEFVIYNTRREFLKKTLFKFKHLFILKSIVPVLKGEVFNITSPYNNRIYLFPFSLNELNLSKEERYFSIFGALCLNLRFMYREEQNGKKWFLDFTPDRLKKDCYNFTLRMARTHRADVKKIIDG